MVQICVYLLVEHISFDYKKSMGYSFITFLSGREPSGLGTEIIRLSTCNINGEA